MKSFLRGCLCAAALVVTPMAPANQGPTALDLVEILAGHSGPMDPETLDMLFSTAFTANMRVPPEHLGVAFHDKRTGEALDRNEIRELMGPVRQDGAYQLFRHAAPLLQGRLPVELEQLELLMDAAFIASMRQSPEHIDIEYYDRRTGPTGSGGGVSGRVPDQPTEAPEVQTTEPPDSLPADRDEMLELLKTIDFGVAVDEIEGLLYPMVVWGRAAEDIDTQIKEYVQDASEIGLHIQEVVGEPHVVLEDGWIIVYLLHRASTDHAFIANELRVVREALSSKHSVQ